LVQYDLHGVWDSTDVWIGRKFAVSLAVLN
jgi:hypothetical protein